MPCREMDRFQSVRPLDTAAALPLNRASTFQPPDLPLHHALMQGSHCVIQITVMGLRCRIYYP